ncbi:putative transposase [Clostridiales Family XIII bacterium PM5-7]
MKKHEKEHTIARMAKVLSVSESGYYKWCNKLSEPPSQKEQEDLILTQKIWKIYADSKRIFGSRKVTNELRKTPETRVNHKRVERLMRENMLYAKTSKRYLLTTDSDHKEPVAENLLQRDFHAEGPNQKMVSDTTVVATKQGDVYIAGILDLYGRMPAGLYMSRRNDRFLVMGALEDALRRGCVKEGCILHSDRGSTYCSQDYRKALEQAGFQCSMSKKGDCWDNAPMESFWGKMKTEWLKDKYDTIEAAEKDVLEYVWSFYAKKRPHAANGYLTPWEYYNGQR